MKPQMVASTTPAATAAGSPMALPMPALVHKSVARKAPSPMNAACPRDSCPAHPPITSQAVASAAKSTRLKPKLSARGNRNGYTAPATITAAIAPSPRLPPRRASDTGASEQPRGSHQEHQQEGDEAERVARTGRAEPCGQRFHHPEQQGARAT